METKLNPRVFINPYGIKIAVKCASCEHFDHCMPNGAMYEDQGICTNSESRPTKETRNVCESWKVRRGLMKAGCRTGKVAIKEKEYFAFLAEVSEMCNKKDVANKTLFTHWRWYIETRYGNIHQYWKENLANLKKYEVDAIVGKQIDNADEAYMLAMEEKAKMAEEEDSEEME